MGYILKIYPENAEYLPDEAQEEAITDIINEIFSDSGDVDCNLYQDAVYVDAGSSIHSVVCPQCDASMKLSVDDEITEWWNDCIEKEQDKGIDLAITVPCCKESVPFKKLTTNPVTGFARFVIEIHDPEQIKELTAAQLAIVSNALGCTCHQVMALYNDNMYNVHDNMPYITTEVKKY